MLSERERGGGEGRERGDPEGISQFDRLLRTRGLQSDGTRQAYVPEKFLGVGQVQHTWHVIRKPSRPNVSWTSEF